MKDSFKVQMNGQSYQSVLASNGADSLSERYDETASDNSAINLVRNEADVRHECSLQ